MKYVSRLQPPDTFEKWKKKHKNANWTDFSGSDEYKEVKQLLIDQQSNVCGYCEIAIEETTSHIEHFKDKHNYPRGLFEYDNFIASCQYRESCGHKKDTNYFSGFVSPFDKDCQNKFTYTRNGKIIPIDENDFNSQKTIDILGLNCRRLVDRRLNIIKALEHADNDYIESCLDNFIDWFCGFYTVIEYMKN